MPFRINVIYLPKDKLYEHTHIRLPKGYDYPIC